MKLFIDSADIDEIQQAYAWGIVDGVTTNPSLMKQAVDTRQQQGEKIKLKQYIAQICRVAKGTPVSLEVTETTAKGMILQGKALYKLFNPIAKNVVIKIPINSALSAKEPLHFEGIEAIRALRRAKIPVNCTLVFTPEQALLAAKAGANFVSPFAGRIDDLLRTNNKQKFNKSDHYPVWGMPNSSKKSEMLHDNGIVSGIDLVQECVDILKQYKYKTQVLAASLRNPRQVREAALVASDIATLPFSVLQEMLKHEKTFEGMKKFVKDTVPEYVNLTKK